MARFRVAIWRITNKQYWHVSLYGYQPLALDNIEVFPCFLAVSCRVTLAFTLSSSCSGLILRFTHWTSCWCLNGSSSILTHPVDTSQERHALHIWQTNCPSRMPCRRRPFTKTCLCNNVQLLWSSDFFRPERRALSLLLFDDPCAILRSFAKRSSEEA